MNKKQLIFMWLGIAAIAFCASVTIADSYHPNYANFAIWVLLVILVTVGLIYSFKSEKTQEVRTKETISWKRGFRRITVVLATIAAVSCAIMASILVVDEHDSAQGYIRWKQENYKERYTPIEHIPNGFIIELDEEKVATLKEAGFSDQEIKDYEKSEFVRLKADQTDAKEEMTQLQKGFWVNLSKAELVGLCILAGLGGAAAGYGGAWFVYFLILVVYHFIKWLVMGFYNMNQ